MVINMGDLPHPLVLPALSPSQCRYMCRFQTIWQMTSNLPIKRMDVLQLPPFEWTTSASSFSLALASRLDSKKTQALGLWQNMWRSHFTSLSWWLHGTRLAKWPMEKIPFLCGNCLICLWKYSIRVHALNTHLENVTFFKLNCYLQNPVSCFVSTFWNGF